MRTQILPEWEHGTLRITFSHAGYSNSDLDKSLFSSYERILDCGVEVVVALHHEYLE